MGGPSAHLPSHAPPAAACSTCSGMGHALHIAHAHAHAHRSRKDLKLSLHVPLGFRVGGAEVVMRNCAVVKGHASHVTRHTSHVTRHTSHVKDKGQTQGQAAPAHAAAARAAAVAPPPPFQSLEYRETIWQPVQAARHVTCDARATAVGHLGVVLLAHDQLRSHPIGRTNLHARHVSHITHRTSRIARHASHVTCHTSHVTR